MRFSNAAVVSTILFLSGCAAELECASRTPTASQATLPLHLGPTCPTSSSLATSAEPHIVHTQCEVVPLGWGRDDAPQILKAVELCGNGGTITLPAPYTYTISSRLYMRLTHARLNVHGLLSFTPDLGYWIENSHRVQFQNMSTAWIIEGIDLIVDGGGWQQGGINGNGQACTNVSINNFAFYQPQFWSVWAQDSRNITMNNIYIIGTNTDPAGNSSNYAINVDGIDTMRVDQMRLENWTFQGGDDCFAPKGNSTNMVLRNFTCIGGGIAFGSVGQYPGHPDFITNISVSDIRVSQKIDTKYGGAAVAAGAYFKSWVGVEMGNPPQGGGGGTGRVSNVTFDNLIVENTTQAVYINKCYFKVPAQGAYCDTSTFEFQNFNFNNISGTVRTPIGVNLNCSQAAPCRELKFSELNLRQSKTNKTAIAVFENAQNVFGLSEGTLIAAAAVNAHDLSRTVFLKFFATKAINSKGIKYNGANTCYQYARKNHLSDLQIIPQINDGELHFEGEIAYLNVFNTKLSVREYLQCWADAQKAHSGNGAALMPIVSASVPANNEVAFNTARDTLAWAKSAGRKTMSILPNPDAGRIINTQCTL
ncbi:pectin lyase-like protein [Aureobasidium pullulans]|uniref:galacturonan 1,4-alpha-galacturonidase n=1 Tax=Aureobasidium pullulans TaxID=5580 RepID=A0A4T0C6R1_AURPU|nr:pectin lyase-like protein [Aureobasidium pullulans]